MAEFVAQEEMDRHTGYWWAPDDRHIAFARVDETPVKVTERFEIAADNVATFAQRYPAAGGPNVLVRLGVIDVQNGAVTWIDLGADTDIYLARVNWLPDGKTLAIQRESRDQRKLDLLFADIEHRPQPRGSDRNQQDLDRSERRAVLSEAIARIHLGIEPRRLPAPVPVRLPTATCCGSSRPATWSVDDFRARAIKGIDEKNAPDLFHGHREKPHRAAAVQHFARYARSAPVDRISQEDGVHGITMSPDARFYVDTFTSRTPAAAGQRARRGRQASGVACSRIAWTRSIRTRPILRTIRSPEFGTLTAADGQTLYYRLFKPLHFDPAKRYPAIVDVYGGPGVQRVLDNWTGNSFTQILTRAGYVVFQLDNRGTAFRGTAFQAPIHDRLGEVEVADQVQGARWLGSQGFVDPARIGVWGWSYGGYMTLMLMFKAPDVFRAGVAGAPVTDWTPLRHALHRALS